MKHEGFLKTMFGIESPLAQLDLSPLLFRTDMSEAILNGRKSQTRRLFDLKKARIIPTRTVSPDMILPGDGCQSAQRGVSHKIDMNPLGAVSAWVKADKGGLTRLGMKPSEFEWLSPWGKVGDLIWVRETWANWEGTTAFKAGRVLVDGRGRSYDNPDHDEITRLHLWKSSLHLPMLQCRTILQITSLRVQRLQDINETDAEAEGGLKASTYEPDPQKQSSISYRNGYKLLWDEINAKDGHGWDKNDWVWAIGFKKLKP